MYEVLAREYGVNIAAQCVRPIATIRAKAKSPHPIGFDLAEAARQSAWLTEAFRNRAETEHWGHDKWHRFDTEAKLVGLGMQYDPDASCGLIKKLAAQYDLLS